MKCNACRRDLTGFEAVATACNHTFCKDCAGRILNQSEPCPVCTAVLTEGDFHTIRVGAAAEQCKYFLYGQTTEEILKAANYAIRFYNEQEFIQCVWKEESLVHSKNEMKQKAMAKIKDVYNAYLREREHVKRLKEERQLLERDKEELREKYNEKSRQKRRLEEMVTHNSNPTTPQNNQQLAHPVYPQAPPNGWGNVDRGNNYGPHPGQTGRVHLQQQSSVRVQYQTPNFANEGNRGRSMSYGNNVNASPWHSKSTKVPMKTYPYPAAGLQNLPSNSYRSASPSAPNTMHFTSSGAPPQRLQRILQQGGGQPRRN